ncbi:CBU_1614 family Dot/Icm T4SS effector [Coxiella burnetii]|uniref:CBU_1614 family Dot/Icm T4SS effector n=1 Tax=Coxiella burnetii TaxID=777 RepID=UPI00097C6812|nr:CBU_1614 family Dot/Icm T4SS effector [Coxiella burnetii]
MYEACFPSFSSKKAEKKKKKEKKYEKIIAEKKWERLKKKLDGFKSIIEKHLFDPIIYQGNGYVSFTKTSNDDVQPVNDDKTDKATISQSNNPHIFISAPKKIIEASTPEDLDDCTAACCFLFNKTFN